MARCLVVKGGESFHWWRIVAIFSKNNKQKKGWSTSYGICLEPTTHHKKRKVYVTVQSIWNVDVFFWKYLVTELWKSRICADQLGWNSDIWWQLKFSRLSLLCFQGDLKRVSKVEGFKLFSAIWRGYTIEWQPFER